MAPGQNTAGYRVETTHANPLDEQKQNAEWDADTMSTAGSVIVNLLVVTP